MAAIDCVGVWNKSMKTLKAETGKKGGGGEEKRLHLEKYHFLPRLFPPKFNSKFPILIENFVIYFLWRCYFLICVSLLMYRIFPFRFQQLVV